MTENKASNTLGALSAVGKILSVLEKVFFGFLFILSEYSRLKQRKAENREARSQAELESLKAHNKIDEERHGKDSTDIIDDFLTDRTRKPK
jgi:cell division protein FtsB